MPDDIRLGGFLSAVDLFDADFFGISPREAAAMDPQQRLLLELGWEAVEHAGILPAALAGTRTGVFVGVILDDYAALAARRGPSGVGRHSLTGTQRSLIANRLSYALGLRGPSMTVDTGQSSSLTAVHLACESLRRGESSAALVGGVNLNLLADSTLRVARFGALSPDGRCHTFDARGNGYVRGEGGGVLLLKPLGAALADGDRVRCVILGSAVGHDGADEDLVVPNGRAQQEVIRAACADAGISPADLQYVELHGTGTRVGDRVEATALGAVRTAGSAGSPTRGGAAGSAGTPTQADATQPTEPPTQADTTQPAGTPARADATQPAEAPTQADGAESAEGLIRAGGAEPARVPMRASGTEPAGAPRRAAAAGPGRLPRQSDSAEATRPPQQTDSAEPTRPPQQTDTAGPTRPPRQADSTGSARTSLSVGDGGVLPSPLLVGSAKTNVGHLEGAAGLVGLLKTVLGVEHRSLPASLNFTEPRPDIPLAELNLSVVDSLRPWPAPDRRLLAGVSSFGLGGTNCHVIVASTEAAEPADAGPPSNSSADVTSPSAGVTNPPDDPPEPVVWLVSGRGEDAVRGQARRLSEFVERRNGVDAAAVARASATRRTAFPHRAAVVGAGLGELRGGLAALADGVPAAGVTTGVQTPGRLALLFPGQGSQWPGMAAELLATEPVFANQLGACADALAPHVEFSPMDLLRAGDRIDPGLLERVDVIQPLLFSVMVALAALWRSAGVRPDAVAGHSQGEIAAAHVAGALFLDDAALLVARRSQAVSALSGRGGMLAVAAGAEAVAERLAALDAGLDLAVVNGPDACVVSGEPVALDELRAVLDASGVEARRVAVDYASHSRQVEEIREPLLTALAGVRPAPGAVPFHSTVTGGLLDTNELTADYWYRNLRHTVRFDAAVGSLLRAGHTRFIEVSPHPVLLTGLRDTLDAAERRTVALGTLRRGEGGRARFLTSLAEAHNHGVAVDWEAVLPPCAGEPADLPTYAFQRERYWLDGPLPADEPAPSTEPGAGPAAAPPSTAGVRRRVPELVTAHAAAVLGRSAASLPLDRPFRELGFDSLGLVELLRQLGGALGLRLPTAVAYDHPTPTALARHLGSLLDGTPESPGAALLARVDSLSADLTAAELDDGTRRAALSRLRSLVRRIDGEPAQTGDLTAAILAATPEEILDLIDSRGES